jgi:hypothetical protein
MLGAAHGDPGRALLIAPLLSLGAGLAALALPAFAERASALRRWRARVDPQPPPRRDPDEVAPEVRAAVRERAR